MPRLRYHVKLDIMDNTALSDSMVFWLLRKRTTRIVGATCENPEHVDYGPGREPGACTRPVRFTDPWPMCARCWPMHQAFHGQWTLFQADPAASLLSGEKIRTIQDIFGGAGFRTYPPEDWS